MKHPYAAARAWIACLLAVTLLLVPFTQVPRASAADGSLVIAALHVLQEEYVDPVQPVPLLNAAISTLRKATNESQLQLPDIAPGTAESAAAAQFTTEFTKAAATGAMAETPLAYAATEGMLASLRDSHTYYLDPAALRESRKQLFGNPSFTGIGVTITAQKDTSGVSWVFVDDVFPGSPASDAGLKRFDRILDVDGHSLRNKNAEDAAQLIRGPAGSTVHLTIERGTQTLDVAVTRAAIRVPPAETRFIAPGVAYFKLFEFSRGAGRQLRGGIESLQAQGPIHSAILDLRGNPGGLIVEAQNVGGVFFQPNTVLARIHERGQAPSLLTATGTPLLLDTPLVVLVDAASASASEILTGAFKDYQRATIVGQKTAGALGGSVTAQLPEGGMSVTVERILTPKNQQVEGVGITPDEAVALTVADMEQGRDTQLQAALHALGTALSRILDAVAA